MVEHHRALAQSAARKESKLLKQKTLEAKKSILMQESAPAFGRTSRA